MRAASANAWTGVQMLSVLFVTVLTAAGAQLSFPLPFTPVPFTIQPMIVLIGAAALGSRLGALAQIFYLMLGVAGLPVFAFSPELPQGIARLMGPTGGYLIGFLPAVYLAGLLSGRCRSLWSLFGAFTVSCLIIHLSGWAQLSALSGPAEAFRAGTLPFIFLDLLKAFLTAALVQSVRSRRPS